MNIVNEIKGIFDLAQKYNIQIVSGRGTWHDECPKDDPFIFYLYGISPAQYSTDKMSINGFYFDYCNPDNVTDFMHEFNKVNDFLKSKIEKLCATINKLPENPYCFFEFTLNDKKIDQVRIQVYRDCIPDNFTKQRMGKLEFEYDPKMKQSTIDAVILEIVKGLLFV